MLEELARIPGIRVRKPEATLYAWVGFDFPISTVDMVKSLYRRGT